MSKITMDVANVIGGALRQKNVRVYVRDTTLAGKLEWGGGVEDQATVKKDSKLLPDLSLVVVTHNENDNKIDVMARSDVFEDVKRIASQSPISGYEIEVRKFNKLESIAFS